MNLSLPTVVSRRCWIWIGAHMEVVFFIFPFQRCHLELLGFGVTATSFPQTCGFAEGASPPDNTTFSPTSPLTPDCFRQLVGCGHDRDRLSPLQREAAYSRIEKRNLLLKDCELKNKTSQDIRSEQVF